MVGMWCLCARASRKTTAVQVERRGALTSGVAQRSSAIVPSALGDPVVRRVAACTQTIGADGPDSIDHHLMSDRAYEFVRGIRIHDLIRILGTVAHKLREQSTNAASGFCIRRIVSSRAIVRSHMLDPLAPLSARGCCLWLPEAAS